MPKLNAAKEECLEHYARREPQLFYQYDGFIRGKEYEPDYVMHADQDGDCVMCGEVTELMRGSSVRVLIKPETSKDEAVRLLHKISDWISRTDIDQFKEEGCDD